MALGSVPHVVDADLTRTVIEHAPALVLVCDREGRILLFNPFCEQVSGYRSEEVLGKIIWETLVPPGEADHVRTTLISHAESGRFHPDSENHWVTKSGRRRLIHWQNRTLLDENGRVDRIVRIGLDVTEHRAAEQAIRHSERRLQRLASFLQALRDVDHTITQQKHRHSLLQRICDILTDTRDYQAACVMLFDEHRVLLDSAEVGLGLEVGHMVQALLSGPLRSWVQEALKHQGAQVVTEPTAIEALAGGARGSADTSVVVTALRHGHRAFGVLCVAYPAGVPEVEEEERSFVAEVAAELALALYALEQERAHEQAQDAAREALEQYRAIVETTNSWIAACDLDLRVRFWNSAAEEMSGYSMLEVLNHDKIYGWLFPEGRERRQVMYAISRVLQSGERLKNYETVITCKDGRRRTISWAASPLRGGTGEITGGVVIGQDVTDRKRAEEAVRERDLEFAALFNSAADQILVVDLRGRILEANRAACEQLGYTHDEMLALGPEDLDVPEEAAKVPERWDELLRTGYTRFESQHRRRDGSSFPLDINVRLIEFQGRPAALSIGRDLTGRYYAMATIRAQRDLAGRFLDAVDCAVVGLDAQGKVTTLNQCACRLLEIPAEEALGRDWFELAIPEAERERTRATFAAVIAQERGEVSEYESRLVTASGRQILVRWKNLIVQDAAGDVSGTLSSGVEVEEE